MIENTLNINEIITEEVRLFDESGFIHFEEQLRVVKALADQGIDFFSDMWIVTHWADRQNGKEYKLNFADNYVRNKLALGWFKNYAKYVVAIERIDISASYLAIMDLYCGCKTFSDYLIEAGCQTLGCISKETMQQFEKHILRSELAPKTKAKRLNIAAHVLSFLNLLIEWTPSVVHLARHDVDVYFKNRKKKLPPHEVILQFHGIARQLIDSMDEKMSNGTWTLQNAYDLFAAGVVILMIGTNSRINEVLFLPTECEYYDGDPFEPDSHGEELPKYGLIMYVEKPTRGYLKPVVPEYAEVVHEVIQGIRKATDIIRRYVQYWEKMGQIQYALDSKTQPFSESLFCFYDKRSDAKVYLSEKILSLIEEGGKMTLSSFGRKAGGAPRFNKKRIKRGLGDLYKPRTKYEVADLCKSAFGTGCLFNSAKLCVYLNVFSRKYRIVHEGNPYKLNYHQVRHFTTTAMMNRGIDIHLVDSLHGRKSRGQSAVYDHPTEAELYQRMGGTGINNTLTIRQVEQIDKYNFASKPVEINCDMREEILELFKKDLVTGPKAKAYQKLCNRREAGEISEDEFKYMEWQYFPMVTIAPIRLGLCTHSWYENPCNNHYNCLLDDYGKICKSLAPFVHPKTLVICEEIRRDIELSLELARTREPSEYRDRWIYNLERKSDHNKEIMCEVMGKLEHMQNGLLAKENLLEDISEKDNI